MMNEESGEASASTSDTAPAQKETPAEEEAGDDVQTPWVRDDELIVKYLKYWIPQFTDIFQNTLYTRFVWDLRFLFLAAGFCMRLCSNGF